MAETNAEFLQSLNPGQGENGQAQSDTQTAETTQTQTTETTTTEAAPVVTEKTEQVFDFEKEVEKNFGKSATALREELGSLDTWKKKAEAESYRHPLGKSFDELTAPPEKGGKGVPPEIAIQFLSDTSKMPERAYKALTMRLEHPEFSDADIQELIDYEYKLGKHSGIVEGDDDATKAEKERLGSLRLKADVSTLRKSEVERKKQMLAPFESRADIEAQEKKLLAEKSEQKRKDTWKPLAKKLVTDFKEFKIPIGSKEIVKDGVKVKVPADYYNFQIPDHVREKIEADVNYYVENNNLAPDDAGQKFITERLFTLALFQHALPELAHALTNNGVSKGNEYWRQVLDHPKLGQEKFDTGHTTAPDNPYDFVLKNIKAA